MDYAALALLSEAERLALAQGVLVREKGSNLILTAALRGFRAQQALENEAGEPGNRFGLSIRKLSDGEVLVCLGGWEDLGIFTAREPRTETEKLVMAFDWKVAFSPTPAAM